MVDMSSSVFTPFTMFGVWKLCTFFGGSITIIDTGLNADRGMCILMPMHGTECSVMDSTNLSFMCSVANRLGVIAILFIIIFLFTETRRIGAP